MQAYTLAQTPQIRVVDGLVTLDEVRRLDALGGDWARLRARGITPPTA